jgi:hypothetical protein
MKNIGFIAALLGILFIISCSPPTDFQVPNHELIWIDVTNRDSIYFADLDDGTDLWQIITDGNVPGYDVEISDSKHQEGGAFIHITGHNPIKQVRYTNTLLRADITYLPIIDNSFSVKVDSVATFRIILE